MVSAESEPLVDEKRALRSAMSVRRAQIPETDRVSAAFAVAAQLAALPEIQAAMGDRALISGFVAIRSEVDPASALDQARAGGVQIAWPRVDDGGRPRLRFHLASRSALRPGRFGIAEPDASCPEVAASALAVMIVPGLAFDAGGRRLGFGGGYYDEILGGAGAHRPRFVVGLGYDFQVVDTCPAGAHDAGVDCVVTDARVIRCGAAAAASARADA